MQKSKIKNQNYKSKFKNYPAAAGYRNFAFCILHFAFERNGITLLLVVFLLSAILSISVGIFKLVLGELRISGETADSFRALYAADQGIERTLYRDRQQRAPCVLIPPVCFEEVNAPVQSGASYTARVSKPGGSTDVVVAGQNRTDVRPEMVVKRGFQVSY